MSAAGQLFAAAICEFAKHTSAFCPVCRPSRCRNVGLIRQWRILRTLEGSGRGATIDELAHEHGMHWRTIARELAALQAAGFPLYDVEQEHGAPRWRALRPRTQRGSR